MSDERRPLLMRVLDAMQEADNYYVSADQAQVAIALVRDAALEEAAKVCLHEIEQPFDEWSSGYKDGCEESAAAIRALKERT